MSERPVGTVLEFALEAPDLPTLLHQVADSIDKLGADAEVVDVVIHADALTADVYFHRN